MENHHTPLETGKVILFQILIENQMIIEAVEIVHPF